MVRHRLPEPDYYYYYKSFSRAPLLSPYPGAVHTCTDKTTLLTKPDD